MSSIIEAELRTRCANNEGLRLLIAQWEYDLRLLQQALTTVAHVFPHYSLHDASHSETILARIAAILGAEGLSRLSATDLWLLLEASYLHDSGMIVLESTRRTDLDSDEFKSHLRVLSESDDQNLSRSAARIQGSRSRNDLLDILEGHLDLLLVYAEFVRRKHAQRSEKVAVDPLLSARLESPRTALIPKRLWYVIGRICRAHGENRDFILESLPMEETGLGGELCHPRFVASMLRLGDLLDLDSDRFCPTINATISELPSLSQAHRNKHAGIRRLLVSPTRIEVSGVYSDVDAYLEAEKWFAWLREELTGQLTRWNEIAPHDFSSLPSAGRIEALLEGQITLDAAARPRFEVDREKMIELVQGANIYDGPEDAVREVIQNAIDATLLRLSYDAQSAGDSQLRDLDDLRAKLQQYPIDVTLTKGTDPLNDSDMVEWILTVKDRGIGVRIDDAKFMLRLGSSKKNSYRRALREWLPDWARPSGTFGIGFHSLFLYCHDVSVLTRHPDDPDGLELSFKTQGEATEPTVIIRRRTRPGSEITFAAPTGTLVEARFRVDRLARDRQWSRRDRRPRGARALYEYDFVLDAEIPHAAAAISELVYDMAEGSLCPLRFALPISQDNDDWQGRSDTELFRFFDREKGVEVRITACGLDNGYFRPRYRGSGIGEWSLSENEPFDGECDLHTSEADAFLELSRNDFTGVGHDMAQRLLRDALLAVTPRWLSQLRLSTNKADQEVLPYVSFYGMLNNIESHGEEWRKVPFTSGPLKRGSEQQPTLDLGTIASGKEVRVGPSITNSYNASINDHVIVLQGPFHSPEDWFALFLRRFFPWRALSTIDAGTLARHYSLNKGAPGEDVTDEALTFLLDANYRGFRGARGVLPCPKRFSDLAFSAEIEQEWRRGGDSLILATMANPFVLRTSYDNSTFSRWVEIPDPDSYVRWLAKKRSEPESQIAELLLEFIHHVDQLMDVPWQGSKRYDLREVESSLRRMT